MDKNFFAPGVGTFDWDIVSDTIRWSPEMEPLYGLPPHSLGGTSQAWRALIHPDDVDRVERSRGRAMAARREEFISEYRAVRPDGSVRWIEARARVEYQEDGRPVRLSGAHMDITERKRFESRLIEQAEALWRSNRELEQLAYVSAHDMKEPLRKISSFANLLELRYRDALDEKGRHYLDMLSGGARRMETLFTDLLSYSQATQMPSQASVAPLAEVAAAVVAGLAPQIKAQNAEVAVGPLPTARADLTQVRQVFQHLLANALKFASADRPPRVRVFSERRGDFTFIGVRDNGIGIEPQYCDRIFKLFQRLHPTSAYPGTGIGLAVSRKIVEGLGGKIWVESKLNEGSTFYFSLPLIP